MRIVKLALFSSTILVGVALPAGATVLIKVDQSTQRMSVDVDGQHLYDWRVSTGRPGFDTPNGEFRPNRMDADHYSQEYDSAPMPHAIFFDLNGHAIHGSFDTIGRPAASHGCVRLDPANATKLFDLVKEKGMANTEVEISGDVEVALQNAKPAPRQERVARRHPTPTPGPTVYGSQEAYQQVDAYGRPYYNAPPQTEYRQQYNYPANGYGTAAPGQLPWRW
jgi:hypothetical protein